MRADERRDRPGSVGTSSTPTPAFYTRIRHGREQRVRLNARPVPGPRVGRGERAHCDVCLIGSHRRPILRFHLTRSIEGTNNTRGAGSILMCEECWSRIAKPRMRSAKRNRALQAERDSRRRLQSAGAAA